MARNVPSNAFFSSTDLVVPAVAGTFFCGETSERSNGFEDLGLLTLVGVDGSVFGLGFGEGWWEDAGEAGRGRSGEGWMCEEAEEDGRRGVREEAEVTVEDGRSCCWWDGEGGGGGWSRNEGVEERCLSAAVADED